MWEYISFHGDGVVSLECLAAADWRSGTAGAAACFQCVVLCVCRAEYIVCESRQ